MYQHHADSLEILKNYFSAMPETVAIVFGGSVAKGTERPDSDLDAMIIITDEAYEMRKKEGKTTECLNMCTYEGGYFDIKYMTKSYIQAAAQRGSEPTRNSFRGSRVIFSRDDDIADIVSRIPVFQEGESEDKMLSFYANLMLNYHYFWQDCKPDGYMKIRTASEIIYSVYRMILQERKQLFQCSRRMEADIFALGGEAAEVARLGKAFSQELTDEAADAFVEKFLAVTSYQPPDQSIVGSRYLADFEQWWLNPRPMIEEW